MPTVDRPWPSPLPVDDMVGHVAALRAGREHMRALQEVQVQDAREQKDYVAGMMQQLGFSYVSVEAIVAEVALEEREQPVRSDEPHPDDLY